MSLPTQQQPALDSPAEEKMPMIQHVLDSARAVGTEKSNLLFAVIVSYALSIAGAGLVAVAFDRIFGLPTDLHRTHPLPGTWKVAVATTLMTAFFLGLFFAGVFTRKKRSLARLWIIALQFITLVILLFVGLSQLPMYGVS